jgi:hypothetical protein
MTDDQYDLLTDRDRRELIDELELDAHRYRWLRKNADPNKGQPFIAIYQGSFTAWTLEGADEKIDKAMAES